MLSEGTDEQHIIEIAFDSFENKRFRNPDVLYPYLKEQFKDDRIYYAIPDRAKMEQEQRSLMLTGDFF